MGRLLWLALVVFPAVAAAQPGPPPPPPPGGGGYYGAAPAPDTFHQGVTFEANIGAGWVHEGASAGGQSSSSDSNADVAGLDLGIGGWLNPRLAITGRMAGVQVTNVGTDVRAGHFFVGPSLQYWADDHIWFGGGAGLSTFFLISGNANGGKTSYNGFGIDLRAGYTFTSETMNTFNVSVELNPGFYSIDDGMGGSLDLKLTGLAFLVGYQYL